MPRNIIRLAGGTYERLKALVGTERLKDREVVISKNTNELYVGKSDGSFELLGNVHLGNTIADIRNIDPQRGRFFYNSESGVLYLANGDGWKRIGVKITSGSGLSINESTGELTVNVDNKSIVINPEGKIAVENTDYGVF